MVELSATKATTLGFKLNVEGSTETPLVRFCVKAGEDFLVSFYAQVFKDKAIVNVPPLSFISEYKTESFESFLEIVVNGSYFVPWKGVAMLKSPVNVRADFENKIEEPEDIVSAEIDATIRYEDTEHKSKASVLKEDPVEEKLSQEKKETESFSDFIKKKGLK